MGSQSSRLAKNQEGWRAPPMLDRIVVYCTITPKKDATMSWTRYAGLALLILSSGLPSGCGGGGSGSPDPPTQPATPPSTTPSFTIELSPSSVSISPNSTAQVTLLLHPINGFSGTVTFLIQGVPFGVTTSPASGGAQSSVLVSGVTITLAAGSIVAGGNYTLTAQATNGTVFANATSSLTAQGGN